jgi:hypothetical protein
MLDDPFDDPLRLAEVLTLDASGYFDVVVKDT